MGEKIYVPSVDEVPEAGVDTQADLDRINAILSQ